MMNTVVVEPKTEGQAEKAAGQQTSAWQPEDDDLVTVIHRNWGAIDPLSRQPLIPTNRETYFDRITFVGGVGRNVPYELAKKWVKLGLVPKAYIFPNNAQQEDFERATGRTPMAPTTLADTVAGLSAPQALALLGEEKGLEFAKSLQRLISSRRKEAEDGTR